VFKLKNQRSKKTMNNSLISQLRHANSFMRLTSLTVIISFSMLILSPTVLAAKNTSQPTQKLPSPRAQTPNDDTQLAKTLQNVEKK